MIEDFDWIHFGRASALVRPGNAGTIVIVPGAMSDAPAWIPFAAALKTDMAIVVVNRQGRTPSKEMPPTSTVGDEVEDVEAMLARLEPPFVMIGWSYGGLLATEAAIGRTDVRSIILYEPVIRPFVPEAILPIGQAVAEGDLDEAVSLVLEMVGRTPANQIAELRDSPAWPYLKPLAIPAAIELAALNRHVPDIARYASISVPVRVIIGELNVGNEPYGAATQHFIDILPPASVVILPGQGHLAHLEDPVALAEATSLETVGKG